MVSNIGREGRSQPSFEARLIHENHPIKDSTDYGVVRMEFEWPNDSRTSKKQ